MCSEASFRAIPENSELLKRARQDREIAELMKCFNMYVTSELPPLYKPSPPEEYFASAVQDLIRAYPGLEQRNFYAGTRTYDAVIYLLSHARRSKAWLIEDDQSLIKKAIWGIEPLYPEAPAGQGIPIGFIPTRDAKNMSLFLDQVTKAELYEHYDPAKMHETGVHKMGPDADEERFEDIWDEFVGMRNVYRAAAYHHEAVITVID
jgi:hypothetical protein